MTASSSTSSRISASSSTSDRGRGARSRLVGWVRLTHPFPSILDGLVSGGVALVAGGSLDLAIRLGAAMTLLQLAIGAVNDVVDAARDAGHKPGKPIPAGLVPMSGAWTIAVVCAVSGVALAASISVATGVLGLIVLGIGLAYDLRLKGTAASWLPFAVGIPILPVFGWLGATGSLPLAFVILVPVAMLAGTALAIGNALVDVERDRAAGISSIAVALGAVTAGRLASALFGTIWIATIGTAAQAGPGSPALAVIAVAGAVPAAASVAARNAGPGGRERAWQAEAVGLAILAAAWLAVVLPGGGRS